MQFSRRTTLTAILLLTLLPILSRAEDQRTPNDQRNNSMGGIFNWRNDKDCKENGIVVGRPKLFDNRDLEIMLDDLQRQLRGLNAIDGDKVRAAIDNLQGSQARSQRLGLEVKPLALPGVTDTEEATDGALAPKTRTTTNSEQKPVPPDLGTAPSLTLPVSNYGSSSQDLLTRQIDLQYQIDNVQMLLQRSVSDRFYDGGPADAKGEKAGARLMVVIGFQISLTPEIEQRGMAAQVDIEIEPGTADRRRPSLVALMPQQKTYNSASLSKKSNAFGAVAPVSAFTVGASASVSGETFYLYQDTDTYAFELPVDTSAPSKLRFGWQFRPVLGRPAVEPGIRQLFAVIALDEKDGPDDRNAAAGVNVPLKVTAKTHWQRYKSKKRLPYGDPFMSHVEYQAEGFPVPYTWHLQKNLTPKITLAQVVSIGEDKALVKIEGENFSRDTSIGIGDRVIQPGSSAFVIRSNSQLQFIAPIADLVRSEVTLTGGRYGFPALVEQKVSEGEEKVGFFVKTFGFCSERKGDTVDLYVVLKPRENGGPRPDLKSRSVFVDFGGEIYEMPAGRWHERDVLPCGFGSKDLELEATDLWASFSVPYSTMETGSKLIAMIPFFGEAYWSSLLFNPPIGITRIILLEKGEAGKSPMVWGLVGYGLDQAEPFLQVYAEKKYALGQGISRPDPNVASPHLLYLSGSAADLSSAKEVTVFAPGYFEPKVFKAPTSNLPPAKEEPEITNTPTVAKFSSSGAVFQGKSLKAIQKIEFEGTSLKYQAKSDEELTVFLTRTVTKEAGPVTLLGYVDDTAFVTLNLTIQ